MYFESVMQIAIGQALKAQHCTDPNPIVGAVLTDASGNLLSKGFHEKAGKPHAEVMALQNFEVVPPDSVLFVTLEPCSIHGKTPPCADLLIQKKVPRVVIGCLDPNPKVAGRGIQHLQKNGVEVIEGVLEEECRNLNPVFNKHICQQTPYVSGKAAIALDGKIAMPSGESQWITGEPARNFGHGLRSQHQAIAIGKKTLLQDDPKLNDRKSEIPRQPTRVLFSSKLNDLPLNCQFVQNQETRGIIFCGNQVKETEVKRFQEEGVQIYVADTPKPEPTWALPILYQQGICSLLVEGGGDLLSSFIQQKQMDRLYLFLSGKIIGSPQAPSWCGNLGLSNLAEAPQLQFQKTEFFGDDLLLTAVF